MLAKSAPTALSYQCAPELEAVGTVALQALKIVPGLATPFLLIDEDELIKPIKLWRECLPDVDPYFARKVQGHPAIVKRIVDHGCGIDVTNGGEIAKCEQHDISLAKSVVTQPERSELDLKAIARSRPEYIVVHDVAGVQALERHGIPNESYRPKLMVRIGLPLSNLHKYGSETLLPLTRERRNTFQISKKEIRLIFEEAARVEKRVGSPFGGFGFAGHGGGNNSHTASWDFMLKLMERLAHGLLERDKIRVTEFDIGGGFLCTQAAADAGMTQEQQLRQVGGYVTALRNRIGYPIRVFGEPGRLFVSHGIYAVCGVKGVKRLSSQQVAPFTFAEKDHLVIYFDSGVYKLFMNAKVEHTRYAPAFIKRCGSARFSSTALPVVAHGDSCDPFDIIDLKSGYGAPSDLERDDLMVFGNMGAYTNETATSFNQTPDTTMLVFRRNDNNQIVSWSHYTSAGALLAQSSPDSFDAANMPDGFRRPVNG